MNESLEKYVRLGRIYSDGTLTDDELYAAAERRQVADCLREVEMGFCMYLSAELGVPLGLQEEVLRLGRKLSDLEIEALMLKKRVDKEGVVNIKISVE